jgi:hypothetical protein
VVFASDTTNLRDDVEYGLWVKALQSIPEEAKRAGVKFTDEELKDFFYRAGMNMLKLELK